MNDVVLLVHRDQYLARHYARYLAADGLRSVIVEDAEACESFTTEHRPAVILLSLGTCLDRGFGFLKDLCSSFSRPSVFVLAESSERSDVQKCLEGGCSGFFIRRHTKPEQIARAIRRFVVSPDTV